MKMSQNVEESNNQHNVKEINVLVTNGKTFHRMATVEVPRVCTEVDILGKVFPSCTITYDNKGLNLLHDKTEIRAGVMAIYSCKISFQYIIQMQVMKANEDGDRRFEKMDVDESLQGIAPSKCATGDIDDDVEFVCEKLQVPKRPGGDEMPRAVDEPIDEKSVKEIRVLLINNKIAQRIYTMAVPIDCQDRDLICTIFAGSTIFIDKNGYRIVNGNAEQRAVVILIDNPQRTYQYVIHLLTIK